MNHHHSAGMPPYGQMPMPPPQRRHELSYSPVPPNMRPQQPYQGYYHPHMGGPTPQYAPQYAPHWYPYQHVQHHHHHHPPPPRAYAPYPQHQMQQTHTQGPMILPPQGLHQHFSHPAHPPPPSHHQSPASSSQSQFTSQTNPSSTVHIQSPFSPPASGTPSTANAQPETPPSSSSVVSKSASEISSCPRNHPFFPPLPWSSVGDQPFPNRAKQQKRRITRSQLGTSPVDFPLEEPPAAQTEPSTMAQEPQLEQPSPTHDSLTSEVPLTTTKDQLPTPSEAVETPISQASRPPSNSNSTDPTTASTDDTPQTMELQQTPTPQPRQNRPTAVVVPIVPAVPVLPLSPKSHRHAHHDSAGAASAIPQTPHNDSTFENARRQSITSASAIAEASPPAPTEAAKPSPPKSWADLVRSKAMGKPSSTPHQSPQLVNGLGPTKSETLAEVLNTIDVTATHTPSKFSFLKPRGLVNTGNMCYMNSVLQILVFTIPFYEFLERIGQRSSHNFKSDTPLIDAMIFFMREFSVIDSAESFERLRLRLKPEELEQYGEPFAPEYAYQVIRQLPRFRDMRRGHQQDAQEFLGFLLEELHEECAQAMRNGSSVTSGTSTPTEQSSSNAESAENDGGWMEVGHRQKAAITRSSGTIALESPVTRIFGGKLRSEWKVPGNKNSVTLEPYQPLQLDIGSPQVNNIVDALKGLTRPESMQGDFNSSRGSRVTATKQVFIESLPPVLILHLKRFQYDSATKRTEKIWKKVGYPLDLEIPKEVFSPQVRNKMTMHGGLPQYQLTGVIYHHGKHAGGGHYTVDVRRQDGKEWIRLDDTLIRRVRSDEVAEGGSEVDPKTLAAVLERKHEGGNMFEQIEDEDEESKPDDQAWSQVNGHSRNKPSTTAGETVVNRIPTPATTTTARSGPSTPLDRRSAIKDKVAYLLFYRRVAS